VASALRDAGVDKWVRGEAHASDHAPAWVELKLDTRKADDDAVKRVARSATRKAATKETAAKKIAAKKPPAKKATARKTP